MNVCGGNLTNTDNTALILCSGTWAVPMKYLLSYSCSSIVFATVVYSSSTGAQYKKVPLLLYRISKVVIRYCCVNQKNLNDVY